MTRIPNCYDDELELESSKIDYPCFIASETFVISGPLGQNTGTGRHFNNIAAATLWVMRHYKVIYERIHEAEPERWAFRVKKGSHIADPGGVSEVDGQPDSSTKVRVEI